MGSRLGLWPRDERSDALEHLKFHVDRSPPGQPFLFGNLRLEISNIKSQIDHIGRRVGNTTSRANIDSLALAARCKKMKRRLSFREAGFQCG